MNDELVEAIRAHIREFHGKEGSFIDEIIHAALATPEAQAMARDAERWRWLRECSAVRSDRYMCVTRNLYDNGVFLGSDTPSESELDAAVDAAREREG